MIVDHQIANNHDPSYEKRGKMHYMQLGEAVPNSEEQVSF